MSDAVFKLFATLGLDTSEYDESLDNSEKKGSSFGAGLKTAAGIATGAIVATTAATVAGTKAFIDGVSGVAQYGDNIDKMSQKLNMSAETYQEWDFIMQHAGTSIETMRAGIKTLSNAVENGNEAFERLGISQEEIANMSGEELFSATITALQGVEDETERTYLAGQLLGRGATELGALLNMSAEETEEMRQQVHDLGGVLSDDAVKSAAQFQDSLQNMQTAFNGVKNSMLSNFLPSFSTVMDGLSLVFSGDSGSGLGLVRQGILDMADNITKIVPTVIEVGGTILEALATAIVDNLPMLVESGLNAMSKFIDGIIDNIDMIIDTAGRIISIFASKLLDPERAKKLTQTAINIIIKLVQGITEALPQLIPAVVSVITAIVTTLTEPENLNALIEGALQLIMALADGIVTALPQLVAVIPTVIDNLVEALINNFPLIVETLLYLIGALTVALLSSLWELLKSIFNVVSENLQNVYNKAFEWGQNLGNWLREKGNNLKQRVSDFFTNIRNFFTNAFANIKNGVLTFFSSVGSFFTNGFNNMRDKVTSGLNAIKDKFTGIFDRVKETVKNAIDYVKGLFDFNWSLPDIELPHFSVSGKLDLFASPPQIPKVSIDWYKKAMNEPYILDNATIFGASNGKLLGGGEAGSELVVGTNRLMGMIRQAVGTNNQPITINVYGAEGQDVRLLAKEVSKELQNLINDKEKVYA